MILVPYREAEHYGVLCGWMRARDAQPVPAHWLSAVGSVAFDGPPSEGGAALAACFLYPTLTPAVGMMEYLISNPAAPKRAQARALDAVVTDLLTIGRECGMEVVTAGTERSHVVRRAARHGFRELSGYRFLVLRMAPCAPPRKEA